MRRQAVLGVLVGAVLVLVAGLDGTALGVAGSATGTPQGTTQQAYAPHINPSDFTTKIDNKYFPLKSGTICSTEEPASRCRWPITLRPA